jgi:hypothetical protein
MNRTKVYKVTLLVVDHDEIGVDELKTVIENVNYPNDCIHPRVMGVETREVVWTNRHPLNMRGQTEGAFEALFSEGG